MRTSLNHIIYVTWIRYNLKNISFKFCKLIYFFSNKKNQWFNIFPMNLVGHRIKTRIHKFPINVVYSKLLRNQIPKIIVYLTNLT